MKSHKAKILYKKAISARLKYRLFSLCQGGCSLKNNYNKAATKYNDNKCWYMCKLELIED
jgi:hypothetical protein